MVALVFTALVLVGAAGCSTKKRGSGRETAANVASAAALVASASASASSPAEPPADPRPSFEVELEGLIKKPAQMRATRYVAIVTPEPCTLDNLGVVATLAIGEGRPRPTALTFWTEGNVREGTKAWICVLGLDATRNVIGFGTYPNNPLELRAHGKGELELEDLDVTLAPVSPPRSLGGREF